ncbi:hypothetical protein GGX14DRAFT_644628 [Mycena pura]|uniref:DUF6532 domain-containing protein n=1 Tax=Mycena pura TaxID=153505 RepID=A0AAD6VC07_9AGAR|nr:hypothetical protein GGX14DRAFT_644628 [Mycena pura]
MQYGGGGGGRWLAGGSEQRVAVSSEWARGAKRALAAGGAKGVKPGASSARPLPGTSGLEWAVLVRKHGTFRLLRCDYIKIIRHIWQMKADSANNNPLEALTSSPHVWIEAKNSVNSFQMWLHSHTMTQPLPTPYSSACPPQLLRPPLSLARPQKITSKPHGPEPLPEQSPPQRSRRLTSKQEDMATRAATAKEEQIRKLSVQNKNLAKKAAQAKGSKTTTKAGRTTTNTSTRDDLGIKNADVINPIPLPTLALIFTAIEHCIQFCSTGHYVHAKFTESLNQERYGLLLTNLYTGLRTETGAPAIRAATTSRFSDDKRARAMEEMQAMLQRAGEAAPVAD